MCSVAEWSSCIVSLVYRILQLSARCRLQFSRRVVLCICINRRMCETFFFLFSKWNLRECMDQLFARGASCSSKRYDKTRQTTIDNEGKATLPYASLPVFLAIRSESTVGNRLIRMYHVINDRRWYSSEWIAIPRGVCNVKYHVSINTSHVIIRLWWSRT